MSEVKSDDGLVIRDEERTPCEVWTRVMGYHRPIKSFIIGNKGEANERDCISEHPCGCGTLGKVRRN